MRFLNLYRRLRTRARAREWRRASQFYSKHIKALEKAHYKALEDKEKAIQRKRAALERRQKELEQKQFAFTSWANQARAYYKHMKESHDRAMNELAQFSHQAGKIDNLYAKADKIRRSS